MRATAKLTLIAATLLSLSVADESYAKDLGKLLKKHVIRQVHRELHHQTPAKKPQHCAPGRPCPSPRPYPAPRPVQCHYYLGVWTHEVQLDPSSLAASAATTGNTTRVVPDFGQPVYALQIDRVAEFSPAYRAGLEAGDVVVSANGRSIQYKTDLHRAIQQSHGRLELLVLDIRTGSLTTVVALPERR